MSERSGPSQEQQGTISPEQAAKVKAKAIKNIGSSLVRRAVALGGTGEVDGAKFHVSQSEKIGSLGYGGTTLLTTKEQVDPGARYNDGKRRDKLTIVDNSNVVADHEPVDGDVVLDSTEGSRLGYQHTRDEKITTKKVHSSTSGRRMPLAGTNSVNTSIGGAGGPTSPEQVSKNAVDILQSQRDIIAAAERQQESAQQQPPTIERPAA
jgi:hypothetical protein